MAAVVAAAIRAWRSFERLIKHERWTEPMPRSVQVNWTNALFSSVHVHDSAGDDRPLSERQLFVRKQVDSREERHCLLDRIYGYQVPYSWLPPTATIVVSHRLLDEHVAVLPSGGWGQTLAIDVSAELKGLKHVILGFYFDFNPVCLLVDSVVRCTIDSVLYWWKHCLSFYLPEVASKYL
jgi:hypothetical protein